jgi:hypothetical protein
LAEKPAVLAVAPEEQDDNWDDDFEEGISFSKLQGNAAVFVPSDMYADYFVQLWKNLRLTMRRRRRR